MRGYVYSLMLNKRDGLMASIMKGMLSFISFFYGLLIRTIRPIRIFTAKTLPCKVISVGNLTLGGTGKTPTACMLARSLKEEGKNPAVLIRGYGDDEWRMMESLLGDIPIIVGKNRVSSGREAISLFNSDTIILDDGFQHWRLKRDLDIVLIDSTNPFGNRQLFPRGILREDIENLKRADLLILTKTDMGNKNVKDIKGELNRIAPHLPILESIHDPLWLYNLNDGKKIELSLIKKMKVSCLSSIVNTEYFEYTLNNLGIDIVSRFHYPDHYNYKIRDLEFIIDECKRSNVDTIVTTEKDAVKLYAKRYPLPPKADPPQAENAIYDIRILVLRIQLKVTDGQGILKERLHSLYRG